MFFEICLIQKLTLFLGYPTHTLTVTLFSLLVFAGIGSFIATWHLRRRNVALLFLVAAVVALTVFYQFGLDRMMAALVRQPFALRVGITTMVLAPLGLCLGAFMPLGLTTVARLTDHGGEYVAWGWAVNGFFSVISTVLATILAMSYGFRVLLMLAAACFILGGAALRTIPLGEGREGGTARQRSPELAGS